MRCRGGRRHAAGFLNVTESAVPSAAQGRTSTSTTIDRDPSNDDLANLMTLCEICHARVHAGLRHEDGEERVIRVLQAAMKRNR